MKQYITLYRDTEHGDIYTEFDMESLYEDSPFRFEFGSYYEFIVAVVDDGRFEEIEATLSDGRTVYPFYWVEEDIGFQTIMEQYMAWNSMEWLDRYYNNLTTFADFLNIPQIDYNAVCSYGFYM